MKDAASEHKKTAGSACSLGSAMRFIGIRSATAWNDSGEDAFQPASAAVKVAPGPSALTRTPFAAASAAATLVMPTTAHLVAV